MATLHVIPHDDEHSVQKNKRMKLNSPVSLSNDRVSNYVNGLGPIRGTSTTLFEDSLEAFEDVVSLTHTIGSSIVLHEAFQVNNRVIDYQYRQQIAAIVRNGNSTSNRYSHEQQQQKQVQEQDNTSSRRKKRLLPVDEKSQKTEEEDDEMATESNDTFDEECNESNQNLANVVEKKEEEEDSHQDHPQHEQEHMQQIKETNNHYHEHNDADNMDDLSTERRSILRQACRMKRLTNLFRNLNQLQSMIVHEINNCMIDTDAHEFHFQQRQLQQQQQELQLQQELL